MMGVSMKTFANGLRGTAVIIAVLGLLDPAISLPWRDRPRVAVRLATPADVFARGDALSAANAQREMAERVRARLAREFIVADEQDRHAAVDALVFVGGFETDDPAAIADALDIGAASRTNGGGAATGSTPASASDAVRAGTQAPAPTPAPAQARTDGATQASLPIAAIVPAPASGPGVTILGVAAPRRAHLSSRVPVTIALAARGLRGRSSVIAVRAEGLSLARATHAWTRDDEQARIVLEVTPIRSGIAAFEVVVEAPAPGSPAATAANTANAASPTSASDAAAASSPGSATTRATPTPANTNTAMPAEIAAHASVAVRITDQPLRVLFVEPRPSWTTRFVRLALAGDTRFTIDAQAQVSRGLAARTADAPVRLTMAALAPFDAVIVGAPEQLTPADVDALRGFARTRGGLIVFAPDRAPQGAYVDLLPSDGFDERLLETPQLVAAAPDASAAASGELLGAMPMLASELALPRALRAGAVVLARLQGSGAQARPVVVAAPLGDGQVLFAGAMDAWRYRDRPQPRFDAFWRQAVFALGAQAPPPVEVTLDPQVVRPGEAVALRAVWRRDLLAAQPDGGLADVRASLSPVLSSPRGGQNTADRAGALRAGVGGAVAASRAATGGVPAGGSASSATGADAASGAAGDPVRLWPGDGPGEFRAILNAPAGAGVYAMSLNADSLVTPAGAPLLVSTDERRRSRSWEALRARVEAHGGLVVTEDRLDRAVEDLRRQMTLRTDRTPRHPWRSAWWIIPFAGCLGGEWLLRRRRGAA